MVISLIGISQIDENDLVNLDQFLNLFGLSSLTANLFLQF